MCGIIVISVITSQNGKEILKDIKTLSTEMCGTVVISVSTSQNGK